jgi:hypothetical protein
MAHWGGNSTIDGQRGLVFGWNLLQGLVLRRLVGVNFRRAKAWNFAELSYIESRRRAMGWKSLIFGAFNASADSFETT